MRQNLLVVCLLRSQILAEDVYKRQDIKHLHIILVQIEVSFTIQNINLSTQQQLHPINTAGNQMCIRDSMLALKEEKFILLTFFISSKRKQPTSFF